VNTPLMGGERRILRPDAVSGFAGSAETGSRSRRLSREISPIGEGGTCVFRRLYFTVRHEGSIQFQVNLIVDGKIRETYTFTGTGSGKRTWMIPANALGTTVQLEITSSAPGASWWVEDLEVKYQPGHDSRKT